MNRPVSDCANQPRRTALLAAVAATANAAFGLPATAATSHDDAALDLHVELRAAPDRVALRSGESTRVWRYHGKLLQGNRNALEASVGGYLGPIIRVRRGQRVRIELINGLPESTITHWHGLHVPDDMDGHPRFAIGPGERYVYEFTVLNRAGTYWFHPHPHGRTGKQVYFGLAGLFLVSDDEEAALDLPTGERDIPLVIQDRSLDGDNQLIYLNEGVETAAKPRGGMMSGGGMMRGGGMMGRGMGGMMTGMMGMFGDDILVNGRLDPSLAVERRAYRLRLLNASNSRIYKLAWSDAKPLTVIGNDGGLLAEPLQRDYVMLAPAQRLDVWVDFARWPAGAEPVMRSLAFESGMAMGGMMMGRSALPDGAAFPVLRFRIGSGGAPAVPLPRRLSNVPAVRPRNAVNFERPKVFDLTMRMMAWGINGRSFEMLATSPLETVKLGTEEVWEFRNDGMGGMMAMPHSMHVHGLQFRVLGRTTSGRSASSYDGVKAGLVDDGFKDTVLVMPGERVRILVRFADYAGLFLYHCHMLEHEDSGLMRNYRVVA
ncbi:MAG: multicopper oxidase domain-containing protein [Pseudomonadota bacterium]|nr:multicopper oxidase domain-containing protein [Pseudomonadota bacterium]